MLTSTLAPPRVVIVEDDDEFRALLVSDLAERGMAVVGVDSAEALYRHLLVDSCDIVVLDVGLPGEDGYSAARHLRQPSSMGILMLTAQDCPRSMARALTAGADMYLVKPIDLDVLAASVSSLQRRLASAVSPAVADTAATQELAAWSLKGGGWNLVSPTGSKVALGEAERAFLRQLFSRRGQPVDRETLIRAITDEPWDFDPHRLEVLIHRLRRRVKAAAGLMLPVRAVRGVGYVLVDQLADQDA
jgi:DNA-binding response OmpR family regulator